MWKLKSKYSENLHNQSGQLFSVMTLWLLVTECLWRVVVVVLVGLVILWDQKLRKPSMAGSGLSEWVLVSDIFFISVMS